MTWQKFVALFDTDPLALGALGGLVAVFVVTLGILAFLLTRKNKNEIARR